MALPSHAYAGNVGTRLYPWPFGISLTAHLVLLGLLIHTPAWREPTSAFMPPVIDVHMVDLAELNPVAITKYAAKGKAVALGAEPATGKIETAPVAGSQYTAEPEISVASVRMKNKRALKTKTFKSSKVLKNTLQRVKKKVAALPLKQLDDTLIRLREKLANEAQPVAGAKSAGKGKQGKYYARGSKKEIELVNLYMVETAYTIQKSWAYSEQMAGGSGNLTTVVEFKVMPDGQITDININEKSGNQYLDDSALKAITKSSPVKPHPNKLSRPYVHMGINFGPKGVR